MPTPFEVACEQLGKEAESLNTACKLLGESEKCPPAYYTKRLDEYCYKKTCSMCWMKYCKLEASSENKEAFLNKPIIYGSDDHIWFWHNEIDRLNRD